MRSLLLLAALLVAVTAQAPPHMLFKPQRYFVGTEASFSLTSYASESFSVTLKLTYEACTCGRSQVCRDEVVYDDDTKTVYPATDETNGQPAVFKVQLPSLGELKSRRYYISMSSSEGHTFLNRQFVSFFGESNGHMLVKTDKPIYKPAQTVNICVVFLDASLRPHSAESTAQVVIRDSRFKQILKTTVTIPAGDGVGCMDILLSDEPNLGTWTVSANYLIERDENQCLFYFGTVKASCRFKVDEFVLPRFEVEMTGPNQIQRTDNVIEGTVTATYTFGERVDGTVRVNATLTSSSRRESIPFYDTTVPLKNGEFTFRFADDAYKSKVLYRYDPFCVKSTIIIVAEVTERGRNATQSTSLRIPLVSNPISLSFTDSPTIFRPGIDYTIKGKATQADGSPAARERVKVTATANNGRKTLLDKTVRTDANGVISQTVKLRDDINCLKITMSPVVVEGSCDNQGVCFSPSPMYSPTNSFLQLTHVSPTAEITPNSNARVTATANIRFRVLHMMVIGQGNVLLHTSTFSTNSRNGVTAMTVDLPVTHAGVPRVKVLGVVAREDGELVADLIEIPVTCQLENQVGVSFGTGEAEPGDQVSVVTTASPNSVVVLGVIDKSLSLLADACKSVDTNNVCGHLRRLTGRSLPSGGSCSTESDTACCPTACSEPAKRAVTDIFNAAGVSLDSNMFQPTPPFVPPPPISFPFGRPAIPEGGFILDDVAALRPDAPTTALPEAGPAPEPEDESQLRDFFPETWIWEILRTNASGIAVHNSEVPDTITTWNAEAFAISGLTGLGISPLTELVVKKDVFVSLELPYSIIFQETVTVTPIVFNFGRRQDIDVRVSIDVDENLELLERQVPENGLVRVSKGTGTPFNIKLKPRAIGLLPITICIRSSAPGSNGPCIDAVRKTLFVKPGCERFQITTNVYASNSSGEHCFDYELPTCVIPGSSKATISVTGDLMSPPDLDRLLVLPYGCGEQNMVRFSLNVVTGLYLMATNQLPEVLSIKIRNNLQTGYQRQLTYLQGRGCFSIWSRGECSLWLTAFTARFLTEASNPAVATSLGLAEGSELVDPQVITGAINYLISNQERSGRFPVIGRLHNSYLLRRDNFVGLTAYVLITLREAAQYSSQSNLRTSIRRAERYLVGQFNDEEFQFCNYGLALTTTAMALGSNPDYSSNVSAMVDTLKGRISDSRNYPGACFLCNDCPSDEDSDSADPASCPSRPRGEGSSSCVETTAYALRALLAVGDREKTVCLAQWLIQIKSGSGGFYSSQDTLVALDALRRFSEETFTKNLNKSVTVTIGDSAVIHTVTPENRYQRRDFQVESVPSTGNCVSYSGEGTAIIQSTLEYHGCSCCDNVQTFALNLATRASDTQLLLSATVRYTGEGSSNMAIVDVEIPSGYRYIQHKENKAIERVDVRGSNAVFYINGIKGPITILILFEEEFAVEDHQQLPVTVYDYYEPDQIVTKYYLPVSSGTIVETDTEPIISGDGETEGTEELPTRGRE